MMDKHSRRIDDMSDAEIAEILERHGIEMPSRAELNAAVAHYAKTKGVPIDQLQKTGNGPSKEQINAVKQLNAKQDNIITLDSIPDMGTNYRPNRATRRANRKKSYQMLDSDFDTILAHTIESERLGFPTRHRSSKLMMVKLNVDCRYVDTLPECCYQCEYGKVLPDDSMGPEMDGELWCDFIKSIVTVFTKKRSPECRLKLKS